MIRDRETFNILLDTIQRFVRERLIPAEQQVADSDEIPAAIVKAMREMGLFGLAIPAEYGGLGLTTEEEVLVSMEMCRASPAFRSIAGTNNGIGSQGIVIDGTEEQKKKYLPRLASGEFIGSFALTEPGAGSDAGSLTTSARREGDHYVLNGAKRYITNAPEAGVFTVMARTDCKTEIFAAQCMTLEAARMRDSGTSVTLEASCCKYFASEMCCRVADRAVQIHGGAGYMQEYAVERFYRDVRLFRIFEGTSQIQQLVIARGLIKQAQGR